MKISHTILLKNLFSFVNSVHGQFFSLPLGITDPLPSVESEAVDLIHGEPCLHFRHSIPAFAARIERQTVF